MWLKKAGKSTSGRDYSIDVVSGIMILVMITNHTLQRTGYHNDALEQTLMLFSFFMPWFFFKGGMFYRQDSVRNTFTKGCAKLMGPYMIYGLVGIVVGLSVALWHSDMGLVDYLVLSVKEWLRYAAPSGNLPLWFLFSFFAVRLLASLYFQFHIKPFIVAVGVFVVCCAVHYLGGGNLYWIINIPLGLMFFSLGIALKDLQYRKSVLLISAVLFLFFVTTKVPYVGMFTGNLVQGEYCLWPVFAISGCVVINNLGRHLCNRYIEKTLGFVGFNSIKYYTQHWIVLSCILEIFKFRNTLCVVLICITSVLMFTTLYIFLIKKLRNEQRRY